jgi:glycyl-tRNA synthetase (class II)
MTVAETEYDQIMNMLMKYTVDIVGITETPAYDLVQHTAKLGAIICLRNQLGNKILQKMKEKAIISTTASEN